MLTSLNVTVCVRACASAHPFSFSFRSVPLSIHIFFRFCFCQRFSREFRRKFRSFERIKYFFPRLNSVSYRFCSTNFVSWWSGLKWKPRKRNYKDRIIIVVLNEFRLLRGSSICVHFDSKFVTEERFFLFIRWTDMWYFLCEIRW